MKYCSHCGNQVLDEAYMCPKCGCMIEQSKKKDSQTSGSTGLGPVVGEVSILLLAFIILFIGIMIMLYASWRIGNILMFVASIVGLGGIPFGVLNILKSEGKLKVILNFALHAFVVLCMLVVGIILLVLAI